MVHIEPRISVEEVGSPLYHESIHFFLSRCLDTALAQRNLCNYIDIIGLEPRYSTKEGTHLRRIDSRHAPHSLFFVKTSPSRETFKSARHAKNADSEKKLKSPFVLPNRNTISYSFLYAMTVSCSIVRSLDKWHRALRKLSETPASTGMSTKTTPQKGAAARASAESNVVRACVKNAQLRFLAWKGDKVLGAAAAKAMTKVTGIQHQGDATALTSRVLSNRYFAENARTIFPNDIARIKFGVNTQDYNDRQWGTLMEAVVALIDEQGTPESEEAIASLAEWLLVNARR